MSVERSRQAISVEALKGQLATGGARGFDGGRQLSTDGTSRMNREVQVRICEGLGVKFPGPTRHFACRRRQAWGGVCSLSPVIASNNDSPYRGLRRLVSPPVGAGPGGANLLTFGHTGRPVRLQRTQRYP